MYIFTFIANYKGGIYMKQVLADNVNGAVFAWATGLRTNDIGTLRGKQLERLREDLLRDNAIPITGLTSVWCIDALVRDDFLIVHIVEGKHGSP